MGVKNAMFSLYVTTLPLIPSRQGRGNLRYRSAYVSAYAPLCPSGIFTMRALFCPPKPKFSTMTVLGEAAVPLRTKFIPSLAGEVRFLICREKAMAHDDEAEGQLDGAAGRRQVPDP